MHPDLATAEPKRLLSSAHFQLSVTITLLEVSALWTYSHNHSEKCFSRSLTSWNAVNILYSLGWSAAAGSHQQHWGSRCLLSLRTVSVRVVEIAPSPLMVLDSDSSKPLPWQHSPVSSVFSDCIIILPWLAAYLGCQLLRCCCHLFTAPCLTACPTISTLQQSLPPT